MKKKVISILLAAVMLCAAGCAGTTTSAPAQEAAPAEAVAEEPAAAETEAPAEAADASGEQINLVVAWWGNQTRNERTQQVLDMYAAAHSNITFDSQPAAFADYFTKISTAAAGNAVPDVLQTNYAAITREYIDGGVLLDLMPFVESGALDVSSIDQSILDSGSKDGKLYCICAGVNVPALIYNKTLTDELGIEIKDNMTTDEFMAISREIYEKSGVKTDVAYGNAESMLTYIMRGEGVEDIYAEDHFSVESEDAFVPFFDIYETGREEGWMIDANVYAELTLNSVEQAPLVYFSSPSSQSWCALYWSNQLTAMKNAAPEGMELEFTTWPAKDPAKADYLHPSMYFSIGATTAHPDEAVDVLNYIINDIDANNVLLAERGIPAATAVADAIAENLSEENKKEIVLVNDVVAPNSSLITPVAPPKAAEVHQLANELVEKIMYGELTSEEASAQLYQQGNTILGS